MEWIMQFAPVVLPLWRRYRWKIRRFGRKVRDALVDLLVIVAGAAVVVGVWYLGFVVYPTLR